MAHRIKAEKLLSLMKEDLDWRKALKIGYQEGEAYFEFGILLFPWLNQNENFSFKEGFLLLLNHDLELYFVPDPIPSGHFLICPSDDKLGKRQEFTCSNGRKIPVLYITSSQWQQCCQEAEMIKNDYNLIRDGFFISIPNKWYEETSIIQIAKQLYPQGIPRPWKPRLGFGFMEN